MGKQSITASYAPARRMMAKVRSMCTSLLSSNKLPISPTAPSCLMHPGKHVCQYKSEQSHLLIISGRTWAAVLYDEALIGSAHAQAADVEADIASLSKERGRKGSPQRSMSAVTRSRSLAPYASLGGDAMVSSLSMSHAAGNLNRGNSFAPASPRTGTRALSASPPRKAHSHTMVRRAVSTASVLAHTSTLRRSPSSGGGLQHSHTLRSALSIAGSGIALDVSELPNDVASQDFLHLALDACSSHAQRHVVQTMHTELQEYQVCPLCASSVDCATIQGRLERSNCSTPQVMPHTFPQHMACMIPPQRREVAHIPSNSHTRTISFFSALSKLLSNGPFCSCDFPCRREW